MDPNSKKTKKEKQSDKCEKSDKRPASPNGSKRTVEINQLHS